MRERERWHDRYSLFGFLWKNSFTFCWAIHGSRSEFPFFCAPNLIFGLFWFWGSIPILISGAMVHVLFSWVYSLSSWLDLSSFRASSFQVGFSYRGAGLRVAQSRPFRCWFSLHSFLLLVWFPGWNDLICRCLSSASSQRSRFVFHFEFFCRKVRSHTGFPHVCCPVGFYVCQARCSGWSSRSLALLVFFFFGSPAAGVFRCSVAILVFASGERHSSLDLAQLVSYSRSYSGLQRFCISVQECSLSC
jgi:hypothetical protein